MPARRKITPAAEPMWSLDAPIIGHTGATYEDRMLIDTSRQMSPAAVKSLLEGAATGRPEEVAFFHGVMRRTWPRLRNALEALRDAANEADWQTSPWTDEKGYVPAEAAQRQKVVDAALWNMHPEPGTLEKGIYGALADMAEGHVCSPTAYEMLWEARNDAAAGTVAAVRAIRMVPPTHMAWTNLQGVPDRLLFLPGGRRMSGAEGVPFDGNQFAVQMTGGRDHPALGSILDTLALWWLASTYGPKWLMQFAERFGVPFIYANYPAGNKQDRDAVMGALRSLSGASYGAFPAGTTIQALDSGGGSTLPQEKLIELADKVCTETILGASLTTETGDRGSQALGNVHKSTVSARTRSALRGAAQVFNEQVIPAILRLNFGNADFAPVFTCGLDDEDEDTTAKAELLTAAKELGLSVPVVFAHEVLGIPQPVDGEAVLGGEAGTEPDTEQTEEEEPETPGTEDASDATEDTGDPEAAAAVRAAAALPEDFAKDMTDVLSAALTYTAAAAADAVTQQRAAADAEPEEKPRRKPKKPATA